MAEWHVDDKAQTIQQILDDEIPGINWLVERDEHLGFRVKGMLMVGNVPHNSCIILSPEEYESGRWLKRVSHCVVHGIADLILRKNRPQGRD